MVLGPTKIGVHLSEFSLTELAWVDDLMFVQSLGQIGQCE